MDLRLCTVDSHEAESSPPLVVTWSLVVSNDSRTWRLHIYGHLLDPLVIPTLADIPPTLDTSTTSLLLQWLVELNTCSGNLDPEPKFVALVKAKKNG